MAAKVSWYMMKMYSGIVFARSEMLFGPIALQEQPLGARR